MRSKRFVLVALLLSPLLSSHFADLFFPSQPTNSKSNSAPRPATHLLGKRRHPPSPPSLPLRNTRSRSRAIPPPRWIADDDGDEEEEEDAGDDPPPPLPAIPSPDSDRSPKPASTSTAKPTPKPQQSVTLSLREDDPSESINLDLEMSEADEGACGCTSGCACQQGKGADGVEAGGASLGVGLGGGSRSGAGANFTPLSPLSNDFLVLQALIQHQASSQQQQFDPFSLALDPLAGLPPLPVLPDFDFTLTNFDTPSFGAQLPPPPSRNLTTTSNSSAATAQPRLAPSNSNSADTGGCCSKRPVPAEQLNPDPLELEMLRAEDIECFDFGSGPSFGGGWSRTSEQGLGAGAGRGGEMDDEDERVNAELRAAGFC
ncbi:hypothetical protein BCR35DRAFT_87912 [Leucosporidium creatinivorum]|uniref:Uncharacterized protein n=1 Tax=Leucosporidium creatinivorum TaxID=106004 RepID=A0A1Y2FBK1_9BASI|nr:hypothetical protein BCR35DRAFT_87912 [Leucosporidium creatinivorum]